MDVEMSKFYNLLPTLDYLISVDKIAVSNAKKINYILNVHTVPSQTEEIKLDVMCINKYKKENLLLIIDQLS